MTQLERIQSEKISENLTKKSQAEQIQEVQQKRLDFLVWKFSISLAETFEKKGLHLEVSDFKKECIQLFSKTLLNPDIPDIAKEKFVKDVLGKIQTLSTITKEDVENLKKRRAKDTIGFEEKELQLQYGNNEKKKESYFIQMILRSNILEYLEPVAYSLDRSFSASEQITYKSAPKDVLTGKPLTLDKKAFSDFQNGITSLDARTGLGMHKIIESILSADPNNLKERRVISAQNWVKTGIPPSPLENHILSNSHHDIANEDLFSTCAKEIFKWLPAEQSAKLNYIRDFIATGNLSLRAKTNNASEFITVGGQKINIIDILLQYKKQIDTFQNAQKELQNVRRVGLGKSADITYMLPGTNRLESQFQNITAENITQKIEECSLSDMIIMCSELAEIIPWVGMKWSIFDLMYKMSANGEKLEYMDRALSAIFLISEATGFGWVAKRLYMAKRLSKVIKAFEKIKYAFPKKLEAFLASGGKIGKEMQKSIMTLGKMLGEEVYLRLDRLMEKQGLKLYAVPMERWARPANNIALREGSNIRETILKWVDTTAVTKYEWKLQIEDINKISDILTAEVIKIESKGSNLSAYADKMFRYSSSKENSLAFLEAGNTWMEARVGNLINLTEYLEYLKIHFPGKKELSEMKTLIKDRGLKPLIQQLQYAEETSDMKISGKIAKNLENLTIQIDSL